MTRRYRRNGEGEVPGSYLAYRRKVARTLRLPLKTADEYVRVILELVHQHTFEHGRLVVPDFGVFKRVSYDAPAVPLEDLRMIRRSTLRFRAAPRLRQREP